jgi:hypothetical protein
MSSRKDIVLFFPKDEASSNTVKALFPNQRALIAEMSEDVYEKRVIKGEDFGRHTKITEDFRPEMIAYTETATLTDAWKQLVKEHDEQAISYQTWFVVW